jgi:hypothetical protein
MRADNADVRFKSKDGYEFMLHSSMLTLRMPLFGRDRSEAIQRLSSLDQNKLRDVLEFIYGGLAVHDNMMDTFRHLELTFPTGEPKEAYIQDMRKLLTSGLGSDFRIMCGDKSFPVHRFVLVIRLGFFASLFESGMKECSSSILIDEFCGSAEHMSMFLEYVYTGDLKSVRVDDLFTLVYICSNYELHEGYKGELADFVMSKLLNIPDVDLEYALSLAKKLPEEHRKIADLIESCDV